MKKTTELQLELIREKKKRVEEAVTLLEAKAKNLKLELEKQQKVLKSLQSTEERLLQEAKVKSKSSETSKETTGFAADAISKMKA